MIAVRKLKIMVLCDDESKKNEQYKFLRDSQYAQYLGLNRAMSFLAKEYLSGDKERFKEAKKKLTNTCECYQNINFGTGIDSKSQITQKVKKDLQADIKNGLARGERSIRNYRRTFPLITRGRDLKFSYNGDEIIIKWVNKIYFKVLIGRKDKNYLELMHTLEKIINGEYKVCTSSIQIDKKLILNLTLEIPDKVKKEFQENRVLGVDLGIKFPAYACVSDNTYVRRSFGSIDEFLKVRIQFDKRRKRIQQQLQNVKGGKGRKDKLQALDRMRDCERKWVRNYNHALSKRIIDFAFRNKCGIIHLEKLEKDGFKNKLLRNWSYYELQDMIGYKAEREGIVVKYVEPAYTSQTCSKCGYVDRENRPSQEHFLCKECGFEINADHNAAINIARSNKVIVDK
ncbi:RNA-guided endonuclease InsQ/TnpB family protein [Cellulosilyticum ruminicola]|uniref:RNA-guided endonuclease InsQ/TnpB family protein n=1 Tax=Cellulosilyticum ruminicola TaxID=425254 RepID=UPI0006D147F1|nr:RNA-guided endonuclease TnpB family protein [Cellulosilyticum ruminicola]